MMVKRGMEDLAEHRATRCLFRRGAIVAIALACFKAALLDTNSWAAESPKFNVTVESRVTADMVTMADSVGAGFSETSISRISSDDMTARW